MSPFSFSMRSTDLLNGGFVLLNLRLKIQTSLISAELGANKTLKRPEVEKLACVTDIHFDRAMETTADCHAFRGTKPQGRAEGKND